MNKNKWLKVVNPVLLLVFIIQAASGLALMFHWNFISMRLVFLVHQYNGLLMVALIVIHIVLNWGWIWNSFFKKVI